MDKSAITVAGHERPTITIPGTEKIMAEHQARAASAADDEPEEVIETGAEEEAKKTPAASEAAKAPDYSEQFEQLGGMIESLAEEITALKSEKKDKAAAATLEAELKALEAELETDAPGAVKKVFTKLTELQKRFDALAAQTEQISTAELGKRFTARVDAELAKQLPEAMPQKVKDDIRGKVLMLAKMYPKEPMNEIYKAVLDDHRAAYPSAWKARAKANGGTGTAPGGAPDDADDLTKPLPPRSQGAARVKALAGRLMGIASRREAREKATGARK